MGILEILLLAIGLSMDAFAVSVCKGLAMKKIDFKTAVTCGIWFGGFQALMPVIGYLLGKSFTSRMTAYTPWIAFVLLFIIGAKMIRESMGKKTDEIPDDRLDVKTMFVLAVATSVDALAVGVTLACVKVNLVMMIGPVGNVIMATVVIGIVTFMLSCIGVKVGHKVGSKYDRKAEVVGGVILIGLGFKMLIEKFM